MAITVSGGTLLSVARYYTHNGSAYSGGGVGWHLADYRPQYPDDWGTNTCLAFQTGALGASKVTISGLVGREENYLSYRMPLRANVTSSDASYKTGGTDGVQLDRATGGGELNVALSPNTVYYLWLFCESGHSGLWQSERYNDDGGLTVTLSGSYGAPATPSAANGTFGSAIGITLSGGSAGARYTVTAACAGLTETLATKAAATSFTWTPAVAAYAPRILTANSATATITVTTYYADVSVGTRTRDITMSFDLSALRPACAEGWVALSPKNEGAVSGFTGYVQGYSKVLATFDINKVTPQYGAAVTAFRISFYDAQNSAVWRDAAQTAGGYIAETDVVPRTGITVNVYAVDSRGASYGESIWVSFLPYAQPTLTGVDIFRCDAQGAVDEGGSYASASAVANYSALNGENSAELKAYVRTLTGTFGAEIAMQSGVAKLLTGLSPDAAYEIKLELTDALGNTAAATRRLPTRHWAMKFRSDGNGVAFGKAAEVNAALELGNAWALVLRDASGNAVALDHDKLTRLLALLN